jgi:uncharacterized protein with PQ loop repeat
MTKLFWLEVLGWASLVLNTAAVHYQVRRQWKDGASENVSVLFYLCGIAATVGFAFYSYGVGNVVYVVANVVVTLYELVGLFLVLKHRRAARAAASITT